MKEELITLERIGRVALLRLNRPQVLNALNSTLMLQLLAVAEELDSNPEVGCIVLTGSERAFAAGADIKELAQQQHFDMLNKGFFEPWDSFAALRTPVIAAVSGVALGGGCELAMMCDFIYAAENAVFGQPEVKIGVTPGMGGSQRLARAVGKAKAMEMVLTGRTIDAREAERAGLVASVFPNEQLLEQSLQAAAEIASYAKPVTVLAKEMVAQSQQQGLREGVLFERRNYYALYGTEIQREGMQAFLQKRPAVFNH
ncbi:MAG: enoyl-CoA hydratase-related protein [Pseudomonadales bacterium]